MLEPAMQFSKDMVAARKKVNHCKKPVDTYDKDLETARQVGNIMECQNLLKNIKNVVDEKQNKRLAQSSI